MGFRFASNGHNRFSLLILYYDKEVKMSIVSNYQQLFLFQPLNTFTAFKTSYSISIFLELPCFSALLDGGSNL